MATLKVVEVFDALSTHPNRRGQVDKWVRVTVDNAPRDLRAFAKDGFSIDVALQEIAADERENLEFANKEIEI